MAFTQINAEKRVCELTKILNGGVDGVAAVEKETDEPGSNAAAASGDAHHFTLLRHPTLSAH
jgi:hypothetical protein